LPRLATEGNTQEGIDFHTDGVHAKVDTDDLEFANGNIRHKKQASGLEHIVIWQDGDKNLHVKIKKNGVLSPDRTELDMTFNDSGHTTDGWWD